MWVEWRVGDVGHEREARGMTCRHQAGTRAGTERVRGVAGAEDDSGRRQRVDVGSLYLRRPGVAQIPVAEVVDDDDDDVGGLARRR